MITLSNSNPFRPCRVDTAKPVCISEYLDNNSFLFIISSENSGYVRSELKSS